MVLWFKHLLEEFKNLLMDINRLEKVRCYSRVVDFLETINFLERRINGKSFISRMNSKKWYQFKLLFITSFCLIQFMSSNLYG